MSSRVWMSGEYSLNSLSGNYATKTTEPVINTDLRRDLEDRAYKEELTGSEDIEKQLEEMGL